MSGGYETLEIQFSDGERCRLGIADDRFIDSDFVSENNRRVLDEIALAAQGTAKGMGPITCLNAAHSRGLLAWLDLDAVRLLDHDAISESYFFPQKAPLSGAFTVRTHDGEDLACWRSAPPSEKPVLVHFHGNGELVHHWVDGFVPLIQSMGFEVFLAEYRGYGTSTGTPRLASMLDDVTAVVSGIGTPPESMVAFGRSVGSLYAIEMVHRFPSVAGLVLESGIHDVYQRLAMRVSPGDLGCGEDALHGAVNSLLDHRAKLGRFTGPCLIMHAEGDHLVRMDHAERNYLAAGGKRKTLLRLPFGDHNSILYANQRAYFDALDTFLSEVHLP